MVIHSTFRAGKLFITTLVIMLLGFGSIGVEIQPALAQAVEPEAYFEFNGNLYRFLADDSCGTEPNCFPNQGNPLWSSINFAGINVFSVGDSLDNDTIHVRPGNYNGVGFDAFPTATLVIQGESKDNTFVSGINFSNSNIDISIESLTIQNGINFDNIEGQVKVIDVIAGNGGYHGIAIRNHEGEIVIVNASANYHDGNGIRIDNRSSITKAPVQLTNSSFTGNVSDNVWIYTNGVLTLDNVTANDSQEQYGFFIRTFNHIYANNISASRNYDVGAYLDTRFDDPYDIELTNSEFYDNGNVGLDVTGAGQMRVDNVTSNNNGGWGLFFGSTTDEIMLSNSIFNENYEGGLFAGSPACIYIDNIEAQNNTMLGAFLTSQNDSPSPPPGCVFVDDSKFINNGTYGIESMVYGGDIVLRCVDLAGNVSGRYNAAEGDTIVEECVFQPVKITSADGFTDIVTGTADPRSQVWVWVGNDSDPFPEQWVYPDPSGFWQVDFSSDDLLPGSDVRARQCDPIANCTQDSLFVERPELLAWAQDDQINTNGWGVGSLVTLEINDPANGPGVDYSETQIAVVGGGWDPNWTHIKFDFGDSYDLKPGDEIKITDGSYSKFHTLTNLEITHVNIATDEVFGISPPNSVIDSWICWDIGCTGFLQTTSNSNGIWSMSYSGIYDIVPGTQQITAAQRDEDGDNTYFFFDVPTNRPPQITSLTAPVSLVQTAQTVVATVTFSDPDSADTHSAFWDWGDGTTTFTPVTPPSASVLHNYASPGVYTVSVTITDAAGESDTKIFQYIVVYDPEGGFVTGGGWITSPEGSYTPDPTLTGKATFGFVSKYKKGATVPTGNTEFQFKVADLNFKSTSYDWLVIAGTKAMYKGVGTINGTGEYGFMLSAIDSTPDKFRIKIWNKATEFVVYDNQLGVEDNADPGTEIGGGSIVIHKAK